MIKSDAQKVFDVQRLIAPRLETFKHCVLEDRVRRVLSSKLEVFENESTFRTLTGIVLY